MSIDLKKYTHIIWDWNGTLLDDAWLCVDVMNGMLEERGMKLKTVDEYRELFDFPVRDYYEKLGFNFKDEPFDKVGMEFIIRYNRRHHETKLHPDVKNVLEIISRSNISQCILSAREQNELISETKTLGVFNNFYLIRGLDDHYAYGKTEVGMRLLEDMGVPGADILFIGDTRHDAEVAAGLGIDCVLIPNGHQSEQRLQMLGVPIIHTLNDLTKLL